MIFLKRTAKSIVISIEKRTPGRPVAFSLVGIVGVSATAHQLFIFQLSPPQLDRSTSLPFFWVALSALILLVSRGRFRLAHPAAQVFNAGRTVI